MDPSKASAFQIKTIMYTDSCPLYLEGRKEGKQMVACDFFLNNVYFKYY